MKPILTCALAGAVLAAALAALPPQSAAAADDAADAAGSVLVQTQAPRRGSLPDTVTAYGSAAPAPSGAMTLSVQAEGRVTRIIATPGEAVHAGQPLLEFHLSAAATSTYRQAQTALQLAQQEQARTARLLLQQLATRDQLAQADKAVSDAQAALTALEKETGGKPQQLITAPFDGVVSAIPVAQGDRVQPGAPLATVTRSGGLVVTVGVELAQRARLKLGQAVHLAPLAEGEPALEGSVSRIDRVVNPHTRLIDVDIIPRGGEPLQGQDYRAVITVGALQGWVVPRDAVLADDDGEALYQVAGGKARRVAVKRLGGDETLSVIDGEIDPKQPLVVLGNYQLSDGAAVRVADEDKKGDDKAADDKKADDKTADDK